MWHLTYTDYLRQQQANALILPEDWDALYTYYRNDGVNPDRIHSEELAMVKDELLQVLPERFIPYVEDGTINRPSLPEEVRQDFVQWQAQENAKFEELLGLTMIDFEEIKPKLEAKFAEVIEGGLHDAVITQIVDDHIFINTEGGFTAKAFVILHLDNCTNRDGDLQVGDTILYEETKLIDDQVALRFITNRGEFTVQAAQIVADFYYRPMAYHELVANEVLPDVSAQTFINELDKTLEYVVIANNLALPITSFVVQGAELAQFDGGYIFKQGQAIFASINNELYEIAPNELEWLSQIYTTTYVDPYAIFSEPVPSDELPAALRSTDLSLIVRAWNTLYENPTGHETLINKALIELAENVDNENNVMLDVYVAHFDALGIITNDTKMALAKYL
ncbi:MAG TPA: DUF4085 domain-containing protein [Metalysinibacillus jejuensis]|uniref:DUF4085 domain-containing protein n=1 Tax=Metalysinibacillus jejuensis TaxID=914327 RepID=A0A921T4Y2_9BACL|nr:DUF4085 domain-containing protein [Metalysinibacillus jejuensis]